MSGDKPRVLFMTPQPFFQWRGSPIRVGFNARALAELGYEVDLLTMPVGEDHPVPGVTHIRTANPFRLKDLPIGPSLAKAVMDIFLFTKAWSLCRRRDYQVIHAVEDAGVLGVFLARRFKTRLVFEKHSDPASYKKGRLRNAVMWAYGKAEAFAVRHADAAIGTGPGLAEACRRMAPDTPAHHIFDIPSSLEEPDPDATEQIRVQLRQNINETLVTYVGSFAVYQGIDLMFEAIPVVCAATNRARFVVIGGSPEEIEERRARLREQGYEERVTLVGKVPPDSLPNYLAASDILLSPRVAGHNTPLKLLDYLKVGQAIVATDHVANRLILDESVALLVAPEARALAEGILALIEDEPRRKELASRGRNLVDETYNFQLFKQRLEACYRGL